MNVLFSKQALTAPRGTSNIKSYTILAKLLKTESGRMHTKSLVPVVIEWSRNVLPEGVAGLKVGLILRGFELYDPIFAIIKLVFMAQEG